MKKEKLLEKADYAKEKKKFTIKIDVYPNGNMFCIECEKEKENEVIDYNEIIGALEIAKIIFIQRQSELNTKK